MQCVDLATTCRTVATASRAKLENLQVLFRQTSAKLNDIDLVSTTSSGAARASSLWRQDAHKDDQAAADTRARADEVRRAALISTKCWSSMLTIHAIVSI